MRSALWVVLIADVRASRRLPSATRASLAGQVRRAIAETRRFFPESFRLAPQLLKGDEIQAVLKPTAPILRIVTFLRAALYVRTEGSVELRVGLGGGPVDRLSPLGPFESDGPAFHVARGVLERVRREGRSIGTGWQIGVPEFDGLATVLLGLADAVADRWTLPQWLAVRERMEGKELRRIAKLEDVSVQSVSKRLITASWTEFMAAIDHLDACASSRLARARSGSTPRG